MNDLENIVQSLNLLSWLPPELSYICFSSITPGCSPKFGVPHSHSNSQLLHAHRNHKWPVPQVIELSKWKCVFYRLHREIGVNDTWSKFVSQCFCLTFCRENLEWLARATNWAKFTATASLGVIHKVSLCQYDGNIMQIKKPNESSSRFKFENNMLCFSGSRERGSPVNGHLLA